MNHSETNFKIIVRLIICLIAYLVALLAAWEVATFVSATHPELSPGASYLRLIPLTPPQ